LSSCPPAAMAASWKASTVARSATKATWTAWPASENPEVRLARPPEPGGSVAGLHDQPVAERGEGLLVEALVPLEVRHGEPYVSQHRSPPIVFRIDPTPVGSSIPSARLRNGELRKRPQRRRSENAILLRRAGEAPTGANGSRLRAGPSKPGRRRACVPGNARSAWRCGERGPRESRTRQHRRCRELSLAGIHQGDLYLVGQRAAGAGPSACSAG
jgi:hypothetical protein